MRGDSDDDDEAITVVCDLIAVCKLTRDGTEFSCGVAVSTDQCTAVVNASSVAGSVHCRSHILR